MDIFAQLAERIIKAQEEVVGPLALEQAKKVKGLRLGSSENDIEIEGDKKEVVNSLVQQYEGIFGLASIQVCKDAVRNLIANLPKEQLPPLLAS